MTKRVMNAIYERNRFLRSLALKLGIAPSVVSVSNQMSSSRFVEYSWILLNLGKECHRILDVGSVGSTLPAMLVCQGYEVYCIDVRSYECESILPTLRSIIGDIRRTEFQPDFFDCVTAVSTIEHVGLGRYGDAMDNDGDVKAVVEIRRILKKGGKFLLTVPYGIHAITPSHRVYDRNVLTSMLTGFCTVKSQCFSKEGAVWLPSSPDELSNVDSFNVENGVICLKLRKV